MKLWLILYAGLQVGGTWGPLPYDRAECEKRAEEGNKLIADAERFRKQVETSYTIKGMSFVCEEREERPKLRSLQPKQL